MYYYIDLLNPVSIELAVAQFSATCHSDGKKRALVIGHGYLGAALRQLLASSDYTVATADIRCTCESGDKAESPPSEAPCAVFVCVSTAGMPPDKAAAVYAQGVPALCHALQVHFAIMPRVVLCSSTALYGVTDGSVVTELCAVNPATPKLETLHQAEQCVMACGGVVARLSALYGPSRCKLIEDFCVHGRALGGAPDRYVNYIHRDAAAAALLLLATHPSATCGVYNVSDNHPFTLQEIYAHLSDTYNMPFPQMPNEFAMRRRTTNQRVCADKLAAISPAGLLGGSLLERASESPGR